MDWNVWISLPRSDFALPDFFLAWHRSKKLTTVRNDIWDGTSAVRSLITLRQDASAIAYMRQCDHSILDIDFAPCCAALKCLRGALAQAHLKRCLRSGTRCASCQALHAYDGPAPPAFLLQLECSHHMNVRPGELRAMTAYRDGVGSFRISSPS